MDSDGQLVIYCEDDGEYRVFYDVCDNLCIERLYKNPLKSKLILVKFANEIN